ncbi:GNAT family N-acetyltransferase [Cellulomonas massiliensis]|uniref:GNAT family N-acetyltransferase n=1 Tax=Cellulomonas massiliensis TaxID=1465811 RepID=UPI0002D3A021|nr:GNAT family N-acetyltransferase [Cellulomonas massiliensis]
MTSSIADRLRPPARLPELPPDLGLAWRPLTPDDLDALVVLVNRTEEADGLPYRHAREELAELFDGDWKQPARDSLTAVDADGRLRAWAWVDQPPGDTSTLRVFLMGGVDPDWRGRGIGRAVLAWSHARARQVAAGRGRDLPVRLTAYADDTAPGPARALRASGLEPVRYYSEMRRRLDGDLPAAPALDGVRVVPWSEELDEAVRLAHNEAFADHWGSEPRTAEQWALRPMFAPAWSFVALTDAGEVAGYLISGRYEQDWELAGYRSGYTELLGVRRPWRGRGVAVALLVAAMTAYRESGMDVAEIGVDTENPTGAHGLYARLGYEVHHGQTMYALTL